MLKFNFIIYAQTYYVLFPKAGVTKIWRPRKLPTCMLPMPEAGPDWCKLLFNQIEVGLTKLILSINKS